MAWDSKTCTEPQTGVCSTKKCTAPATSQSSTDCADCTPARETKAKRAKDAKDSGTALPPGFDTDLAHTHPTYACDTHRA